MCFTVGESEKPPLTPLRPKVNSIFHLFGEWLFEAALIGTTPVYNNNQRKFIYIYVYCREFFIKG